MGLLIALVSYILALTLIIGDLFFDSQSKYSFREKFYLSLVFGHTLHRFHEQTRPLIPPKTWIAPLWMTVYGLQVGQLVCFSA